MCAHLSPGWVLGPVLEVPGIHLKLILMLGGIQRGAEVALLACLPAYAAFAAYGWIGSAAWGPGNMVIGG